MTTGSRIFNIINVLGEHRIPGEFKTLIFVGSHSTLILAVEISIWDQVHNWPTSDPVENLRFSAKPKIRENFYLSLETLRWGFLFILFGLLFCIWFWIILNYSRGPWLKSSENICLEKNILWLTFNLGLRFAASKQKTWGNPKPALDQRSN